MSKVIPLITIGPTIPSLFLDNRLDNDREYGYDLFRLDSSSCTIWHITKPANSVIFGSMANLSEEQMEELTWGLKETNLYFLCVVRTFDEENKIPK